MGGMMRMLDVSLKSDQPGTRTRGLLLIKEAFFNEGLELGVSCLVGMFYFYFLDSFSFDAIGSAYFFFKASLVYFFSLPLRRSLQVVFDRVRVRWCGYFLGVLFGSLFAFVRLWCRFIIALFRGVALSWY